EELLLLWLANVNPAFAPFLELFDEEALQGTRFAEAVAALGEFFATQPVFGPDHQSLTDMLRAPAIGSPHSLSGQLEYIRRRWGITALWIIGLWERSPASQRIKQLCGNPDAAASAYSLVDYSVAQALGGDGACEDLRARAWRRGIRLASDMVPNHMGIDSRWVMEHP